MESMQFEAVDLWNPDGVTSNVDVFVNDGIVSRISPAARAPTGMVLMPAGVDPQVHLRTPGQPEKETPITGVRAAQCGGIGAVLTMPNTKPVLDNPAELHGLRDTFAAACEQTGVRVYPSASITIGLAGRVPSPYHQLAEAGAKAFTDDGLGVRDDAIMEAVFRASADLGLPVLQHAEFPGHGGVLAPGPFQKAKGIKAYDPAAEYEMVARDLKILAKYPGARYHLLHTSSATSLEMIRAAKEKGLRATCEVSPHHLYFSCEDISEGNTSFKMNPPLRSPEDQQALIQGLNDGLIDFVATDHAPHEPQAKGTNFQVAAYGTTGLETSLRVLFDLKMRGHLSASRLVQVFSSEPAKFLGLDDMYGRLSEGRPFNAVLCRPDAPAMLITVEDLHSKSKNNVFLGAKLAGEIHQVHLSGCCWENEAIR